MKRVFISLTLMCSLAASLEAALWLPSVFSDNLVLQAGDGTPVFGKADAGATVDVSFVPDEGKAVSTSAVAGPDGRFVARLGALTEGAKGALTVKSAGDEKVFKNALVGEVWLCSGQSNMEFVVSRGPDNLPRVAQAQKEAAAANGQIRMFRVSTRGMDKPDADVEPRAATWEVVTPENVSDCSAVSWNFAVKVREQTGFPVGLVISSWGGTGIEAWLSAAAIKDSGVAEKVKARHIVDLRFGAQEVKKYQQDKAAFAQKYPTPAEQEAHKAEAPEPPKKAYSPRGKNVPSRLYNGMINGLLPYGLRGMLWYQGEHNGNVKRAAYYAPLAQSLVNSRRAEFENPNLAFYYVELANFRDPQKEPVEPDGWGLIREAQGAVLSLPLTGVATAIDVGAADDVHPTDKKTVGNRLAGMALNDLYGKPSLCRSPEFKSANVEGDAVIVSLNHAEGLRPRGALEGFAVRADKGDWVWAEDVQILPGNALRVRSAQVPAPAAVRYGWANNPKSTVENAAGLPLRPFRTDQTSQ